MNKFEFKILQGLSEFQDVIDPWNELFETCGGCDPSDAPFSNGLNWY